MGGIPMTQVSFETIALFNMKTVISLVRINSCVRRHCLSVRLWTAHWRSSLPIPDCCLLTTTNITATDSHSRRAQIYRLGWTVAKRGRISGVGSERRLNVCYTAQRSRCSGVAMVQSRDIFLALLLVGCAGKLFSHPPLTPHFKLIYSFCSAMNITSIALTVVGTAAASWSSLSPAPRRPVKQVHRLCYCDCC